MKTLLLAGVFLVLLAPSAAAQCTDTPRVTAMASNQRVDLAWTAPVDCDNGTAPAQYEVQVFQDGKLLTNRTVDENHVSFVLTNEQEYAFLVYPLDASGGRGPPSAPVAATPELDTDLQYLAAGLIVTWLALFGYAAILSRKEARLANQLEKLLQTQFGRNLP